jgi:hypothetical protein
MFKKTLWNKAFLPIIEIPRNIFLIILSPIVFLYQKTISPLLGPRCKYHPSCSNYFVEAIKVHGVIKGFSLGVLRIIRCNPFSGGGFNPVPKKGHWLASVYSNGSPRG